MAIMIDGNRVEFLGIEIIFTGEDDPRGSVWVEFNENLSLLYGKNGAGKSTILNAVAAFIEGKSLQEDGLLIHGYARLVDPSQSCSIIEQCIKSIPNTPFLIELEGLETSEMAENFETTREALDLPHEKWEPSLFSATPDSWDELDMDWNKFVSHYLFIGHFEKAFKYDLPSIKSFTQHLIDERVFCLRPTGREDKSEWRVSLAASLANREVRDAYEFCLVNPRFGMFWEMEEQPVSQILQDVQILAERSDMPRTSSPFIAAAEFPEQKIALLGMFIVDLNEEIDLEEWTKRRISELVHTDSVKISDCWFADNPIDPSPTLNFFTSSDKEEVEEGDDDWGEEKDSDSEGETLWSATFGARVFPHKEKPNFEFVGERQAVLQRTLTFIADELPDELAISDLRIKLERDLGLWIFDRPGVLEAFDDRSETWIPVSSTSNATQKIIGIALKIHADIRSTSEVVIAVGDEIDRGLHTLAINGLYKMLSNSVRTCFVTTHSSVALSAKLGERLHVHRGANGAVLVSPVSNSDFLSTSALNFGVRVNELIGMIDLVVAVEGLHDKLVLEHFIKLDERLSGSNILIISMTGVNNATNLVDANFLLTFTDLRILAVADNTSKSDLQLTWQATREQLQSGQYPLRLAMALRNRAEDLKKQRWHEQRCMVELLAAATEGDLLHRLRMSGHIYMDIEMALDPKYFELDKDWMELETEFDAYKASANSSVRNFKDFLRSVYNVSIDLNSIKTALSMTQETPQGIKSVIDDIVANAFQTDKIDELF
jgi:energy-coupling factor transporter ATP-binding protein EcfA2